MNEMPATHAPQLSRAVDLRFRGDWGQANMTRICGWLAQEIGDRAPQASKFTIIAGRGGVDAVDALAAREADIAVVTPGPAARLLRDGGGPAGRPPSSWLRALGVIGQRDRLVVAADADLGVQTVHDLLGVADQLVIGTSPNDGVNAIGFATYHALDLAGASMAELLNRGAKVIHDERPFPVINAFAAGDLNVVITEAVMQPAWQRIASNKRVRYLDWGHDVFAGFEALGWPTGTVNAGYLPELEQDLVTLDFSDFVLLCRDDLDDDVAYLAAWCMVQTRMALESQYSHIPPDRSPVTYPLDPAFMRDTPIPLHDSARRAYDAVAGGDPLTSGLLWS